MITLENNIEIEKKIIGAKYPTYFVADIAANHDGDLNKAKDLICLAKESGADAAKFQHFKADTIVSDYGFKHLNIDMSHQSEWKKSVFEVYKDASINLEWTEELSKTCQDVGITFFSTPYSIELVNHIDRYVPAYKIGSGDITWIEIIKHIASKGKPYLMATGASNFKEVNKAVSAALKINNKLVLMQCNTNYTGSLDNFNYIHLNVISEYKRQFPNLLLGLSDHTPGHTTVLGAVTLGAKVIEKHFTDDTSKEGPDHHFAMNPKTWKDMVLSTRDLENSLGSTIKKIENNEKETVIIQRRSIRALNKMQIGQTICKEDLIFLRPCPEDGIPPYEIDEVIGKKLGKDLMSGEHITWKHLS